MDSQGDINLARELQAEFGRAKPARRRGHRGGGGAPICSQPPRQESRYQDQYLFQLDRRAENIPPPRGRGRYPTRGGALPVVRPHRPPFHGQLVTNGADMFFHLPPSSLPLVSSTSAQSSTVPVPSAPQPSIQARVPHSQNLDSKNDTGAFRIPLYQTTNQLSPGPRQNATLSTSIDTNQRVRALEENGDIQMGGVDYPLTATSQPKATTNHSKGLAGSRWNPANENAKIYSTGSSEASLKPRPRSNTSSSTRAVETVTSGMSRGPGLRASRWCE
ncbi:hypothetical protein GGR51DRAFT_577942 [Nemania sp. FL0031]|nr:hypothetical protein GGR51DRAFT_577942 [Nemania sp. FL0031]